MTETQTFLIGLITPILAFITTVVGLILTYKINKMHKQFNSRMDEYLEVTKTSAHAEGVLDEKEKQQGVQS